jgi:hypothetical protein
MSAKVAQPCCEAGKNFTPTPASNFEGVLSL